MDARRMQAPCAGMPGAWPDNPWDHEHPVFKVGPGERGKIFAFLGSEGVGVKAATTREVADEWLHATPGTDGALAMVSEPLDLDLTHLAARLPAGLACRRRNWP